MIAALLATSYEDQARLGGAFEAILALIVGSVISLAIYAGLWKALLRPLWRLTVRASEPPRNWYARRPFAVRRRLEAEWRYEERNPEYAAWWRPIRHARALVEDAERDEAIRLEQTNHPKP